MSRFVPPPRPSLLGRIFGSSDDNLRELDQWIEETLIHAAVDQSSHTRVPAPRIEDALAKIVERLEAIEGQKQPQGFWARLFGR